MGINLDKNGCQRVQIAVKTRDAVTLSTSPWDSPAAMSGAEMAVHVLIALMPEMGSPEWLVRLYWKIPLKWMIWGSPISGNHISNQSSNQCTYQVMSASDQSNFDLVKKSLRRDDQGDLPDPGVLALQPHFSWDLAVSRVIAQASLASQDLKGCGG